MSLCITDCFPEISFKNVLCQVTQNVFRRTFIPQYLLSAYYMVSSGRYVPATKINKKLIRETMNKNKITTV